MGEGWQISTGDFTELLGPIVFAFAALASASVLFDARRRTGRLQTTFWTIATLFLPFVCLPLYFAVRLLAGGSAADTLNATETNAAPTETAETSEAAETGITNSAATVESLSGLVAEVDKDAKRQHTRLADEVGDEFRVDAAESDEKDAGSEVRKLRVRWRELALPLMYAAALVALGCVYFALDWRTFDAHFARAKRAKLRGETARTIREYRSALGRREDAHTRKLLGLELLQAGQAEEALAEFRAAARETEIDDSPLFHEGRTLDALARHEEAIEAYRRFSAGALCARDPADARCAAAHKRLQRH